MNLLKLRYININVDHFTLEQFFKNCNIAVRINLLNLQPDSSFQIDNIIHHFLNHTIKR